MELDEPIGVDALESIASAIDVMLPRSKHFILIVLGEGPTKLEMTGDIPPDMTPEVIQWAYRVATDTETPPQ